jgi:uncharacterized protein
MRAPRSLHLGFTLAVAALPLSCGGCDRHVEEPLPEVHPTPDPRPLASTAPSAKPDEARAEKPWGQRCVRESPRVAVRKTPPSPNPNCPRDPDRPAPLRTGKVTFAGPQATTLSVEIAEKDRDRQRGLMYRIHMPDDQGMIFGFEEKSNHSFWMHNTCIPLDMLYIDDDGLIVGIEENTPTLSDDTFEVGCDSKYVLEVNAGWTRAHGVTAGQKVKIDGI